MLLYPSAVIVGLGIGWLAENGLGSRMPASSPLAAVVPAVAAQESSITSALGQPRPAGSLAGDSTEGTAAAQHPTPASTAGSGQSPSEIEVNLARLPHLVQSALSTQQPELAVSALQAILFCKSIEELTQVQGVNALDGMLGLSRGRVVELKSESYLLIHECQALDAHSRAQWQSCLLYTSRCV